VSGVPAAGVGVAFGAHEAAATTMTMVVTIDRTRRGFTGFGFLQ
jgi:hypothetical protein